MPANSGAVHGARYNARCLVSHLARTRFDVPVRGPAVATGDLVDVVLGELAAAPELWHQRAYLARVISLDAAAGPVDEGIVPLAAFVDGQGDDGQGDALALTLEADGTGAIYPVLYVRRDGRVDERPVEPDPLLRFDTPAVRTQVEAIIAEATK
jgi:hypothetical protein